MRPRTPASSNLHSDVQELLSKLIDQSGADGLVLFQQNPDLPEHVSIRHSMSVRVNDDQDVLGTLRYSPVGDVMADRRSVLIQDVQENLAQSTYLLRAVDFKSCLGVFASLPFTQQHCALFLFANRASCFTEELRAAVEREAEKLGVLLLRQSVIERFLNSQGELLRSQLRAGALHDLRNALGSLDFRLDRLSRKAAELDEKPSASEVGAVQLLITEIQGTAEEMKKTTDLFRELSTSDEIELVEVNAVVSRIIDRHRPLASHLNVQLDLHEDDDLPSTYMNLAHLQQVIDNLVLNALQWSADRRDRRVRVETQHDSEAEDYPIAIRVTDTGPGIHRQLQEQRIYELGFTRRKNGSGLGLFVARVLTEAAGGQLLVESSIMEVGTQMLLRLPQVRRDQLTHKKRGEKKDESTSS